MASTSAGPTRVHEEHLDALDLAAEHHAEGRPGVTLDEQDRVVLHHRDGRIELR